INTDVIGTEFGGVLKNLIAVAIGLSWGYVRGWIAEVIAVVSALSIQDPRERPLEKRAHADQLHARFADPTSDFLTLLNLWNHIEDKQDELSSSAFRRLCKAEFLNYLRIREWQDLYRQLSRAAKQVDVRVGQSRSDDGDGEGAHA
ncbi:hypothetical protein IAE22_31450, partial [Bacillus sp. S34]|nr:hypothetical protein [Bacillus sp. S34]